MARERKFRGTSDKRAGRQAGTQVGIQVGIQAGRQVDKRLPLYACVRHAALRGWHPHRRPILVDQKSSHAFSEVRTYIDWPGSVTSHHITTCVSSASHLSHIAWHLILCHANYMARQNRARQWDKISQQRLLHWIEDAHLSCSASSLCTPLLSIV